MTEAKSEIKIPEGVEANVSANTIVIKGKLGEVKKTFPAEKIKIKKKDDAVVLSVDSENRKQRAMLGTWSGHVQNMIHGVTDGVEYKMKVVYSHFPMTVKTQGENVLIENFLGERFPRKTRILPNVTVNVKGQDITVKGFDLDNVAQTAANIEQVTRIRRLDPRVFQDGIYIIEKDGKEIHH
jgi:large subunit ribosomal protein L6